MCIIAESSQGESSDEEKEVKLNVRKRLNSSKAVPRMTARQAALAVKPKPSRPVLAKTRTRSRSMSIPSKPSSEDEDANNSDQSEAGDESDDGSEESDESDEPVQRPRRQAK